MIISFFFRDYSRIIIHGDRRCVANQSSNPKTELTCVNRSPTPPPPQHHQKKNKNTTKQKTDLRTIKGSYFSGSVIPSNVLRKIKYNNNNNSNNNNDNNNNNNNNNSNNNNGNFICVLEYTIVNLATYRQFTNAA